jgi:2'-5' RNA ligase
LAPSLVGSSRTTRYFSDIDTHLLVVVEYDGFKESDFHNPDSLYARAMEQYIIEYLQESLNKGLIFSDLKGGEYDYTPQAGLKSKSRSIKWSLNEVLQKNKKIVLSDGTASNFSIRQAITSGNRLKLDWLTQVEMPEEIQNLGMKDRIIEASVLFDLAARSGNNTPIPFLSYKTVFPQLNATGGQVNIRGQAAGRSLNTATLFFDADDFELARLSTVSAPHPDISFLNIAVINSSRNYIENGKIHKALRFLYTRLHYWNDFQAFNQTRAGGPVSASSFKDAFEQIINNPRIRLLNIMYESAHSLDEAIKKGHKHGDIERQLRHFLRTTGLVTEPNLSLEELAQNIIKQAESEVQKAVAKAPIVLEYVKFVHSTVYSNVYDVLSKESSYVSLELDSRFVKSYEQQLEQLKSTYPNLEFSKPEDLHMTIAFVGRIPETHKSKVAELLNRMQPEFSKFAFSFNQGSVQLVGRNNNILAYVFNEKEAPQEFIQLVKKLRAELVQLGLRPDRFFDSIMPHISFARLPSDNSKKTAATHEIPLLLANLDSLYISPEFKMSGKLIYNDTRAVNQQDLKVNADMGDIVDQIDDADDIN